jgi:hypothetical protein
MKIDLNQVEEAAKALYIRALKLLPMRRENPF